MLGDMHHLPTCKSDLTIHVLQFGIFLCNSSQRNSPTIHPVSTLANSDIFKLQNLPLFMLLYLDCQGRFEGAERSGFRGRPLWLHAILRQPKRNGRLPFLEDWLLGFPSWTQEIPYQVRPRQITLMYVENTEYNVCLQNSSHVINYRML